MLIIVPESVETRTHVVRGIEYVVRLIHPSNTFK